MESIPLFKDKLAELEKNRKKKNDEIAKEVNEKLQRENETSTLRIVDTFDASAINNSLRVKQAVLTLPSVPTSEPSPTSLASPEPQALPLPSIPLAEPAIAAPSVEQVMMGASDEEDLKVKKAANLIVAKVLFGTEETTPNVDTPQVPPTFEEMTTFTQQIVQQANNLRRVGAKRQSLARKYANKSRHQCKEPPTGKFIRSNSTDDILSYNYELNH